MTSNLLGISAGIAVGVGLSLAFTAPAVAQDDVSAQVEAVRAAAERFKDVNVTLQEGYIADPSGHCATAEMEGLPAELGAMGIHYFRPDILGITATDPRVDGTDTHTDFQNPAILLYEPQADGTLELVGVENLVFLKSWEEAGNTDPPTFAGRNWDRMEDDPNTPGDEAHGFAPHYDQHVWFRENPSGALEPFNPNVTCEHHTVEAHQQH